MKCVTREFDRKSGISGRGYYMYRIGQKFLPYPILHVQSCNALQKIPLFVLRWGVGEVD